MSSISKERLLVLRNFGVVMAAACGLIAGVLLWKGNRLSIPLSALALLLLLCGMSRPELLDRFERVWMRLAEKMSIVATFVILAATFYLVITPTGLLLRLFKKDLLGLRLDRDAETYWVPVEEDGPGSRPFTPY